MVTSRILPVQIHDLHPEDKSALENELGGVLRAIEFIYREPGVNKPLTAINSGYKRTAEDDLFIGYLYNETGRRKEAISILANYSKLIENQFNNSKNWENITGLRLAAAYAIIGENQKALIFIKYYQPNKEIIGVFFNPKTFPGFDNLRNDPEFKAILHAFGRSEDCES